MRAHVLAASVLAYCVLCVSAWAGQAALPPPDADKLKAAAEGGDLAAEFAYAEISLTGRGVKQDKPLAIEWLRKAADHKLVDAMRELARLSADGTITGSPDMDGAINWTKLAADLGDGRSMTALGVHFHVRGDDKQALHWFTKAAAAGDALGQARLGEVYVFGLLGVKADLPRGHQLLAESMQKETPYAEAAIGLAYAQGKGVPQDFKRAAEWCDSAARKGEARGAACMGALLMDGSGVAKDEKRGRALLELAARNNDPDAKRLLGAAPAPKP